MKAMIFAAGMGTRLHPLTLNTPKALIKVKGIALLEHVIRHLKRHGVDEIVINIHYLGAQIVHFLEAHSNFGIPIHISDERDKLLDTGGGLLKAASFFDDGKSFIVYNVDILSDIDLKAMYHEHIVGECLATLAVRNRTTNRYFLFDNENYLKGWRNIQSGEEVIWGNSQATWRQMAFSGIHIINPKIFKLIENTGCFSITTEYLKLAQNNPIKAYEHSQTQWFDIGKHETLKEAQNNFSLV